MSPTSSDPSCEQETTTLGCTARSDLWFYPGEELAEDEMRVTLMGTGWGDTVRPEQKGPSIFVELGNGDSFVFDCGPGCILNYNAMNVPRSRMNPIFLTHLHMDHCSDLPFIYAFGPSGGDRFVPLQIYGPSGPEGMGLKNLVAGMEKYTEWHVTSFKTVLIGSEGSYVLKDDESGIDSNIHEFDSSLECGVAYDSWHGESKSESEDRVVVKYFPALHVIDGAVSYRLEWTPANTDRTLVLVYSGDTLPNDYMIQHGKGADLLIHETAPTFDALTDAQGQAPGEAAGIICSSHTPAVMLGEILHRTDPQLGVTTHCPIDPQSVDQFITDVRSKWQKPYQIGADFMVFNVGPDGPPRTRMGVPIERPYVVRVCDPPAGDQPPLDPANYQDPTMFCHAHYSDSCRTFFKNTDPERLEPCEESSK